MELPINTRSLNVFKLVMISVISVDSIRNIPISAQYGFSLITFYILAGVTFFLPLILVTSRFASEYPYTGGSYLWIEAAFGKKLGFLSVWLQWVYQLIWYPTIFAFICTIVSTLLYPTFRSNNWFILLLSLFLFWSMTLISSFGIKSASWISAIGAILGTLLPMLLIICLAAYWLFSGRPVEITMSWAALIPNHNVDLNLGFFANFLFSLVGLDVVAMHAGDVKNPQSTYKRAISISGFLILTSLVFSSLALCLVVSPTKIGLISGLIDAFSLFFKAYHLQWLTPIIGISIVVGSLGIAFSWIMALARGLQVACASSNLLIPLQKLNRHNMPRTILLGQAIIFSLLITVFLVFPNVNNSYWILSALTSQFALAYYVLLFVAAIKLRHGQRDTKNSTLKNFHRVFFPTLAILISIVGIGVGFLPPSSIPLNETFKYELLLMSGIVIFCAPLWFVFKHMKKKPESRYKYLRKPFSKITCYFFRA